MHFNFRISQIYEKKEIVNIFQNEDSYGVPLRAKQWDFPEYLAVKISSMPINQWERDLDNILFQSYLDNKEKMEYSLNFFNSFWRKNDEYYFSIIEKAIGEKIGKYNVSLTYFIAGSADWNGYNLCTNAYSINWKGKYSDIYGLLFEAILSYFFKKIKNKYSNINDQKIWAVAELISFIILHSEFNVFNYIEKTYYKEVDPYIN